MKKRSKPLIVITGGAGAGKDTVFRELKKCGFNKAVGYTTRTKRPSEIDEIDYHFISFDSFKKLVNEDFFAEYRVYKCVDGKKYYGTPWHYLQSPKFDFIELTPSAVNSIREKGVSLVVIYLHCPKHIRRERMLQRLDDIEEVDRRLQDETAEFNNLTISTTVDYIVDSNRDLKDIVCDVIKIYNNL